MFRRDGTRCKGGEAGAAARRSPPAWREGRGGSSGATRPLPGCARAACGGPPPPPPPKRGRGKTKAAAPWSSPPARRGSGKRRRPRRDTPLPLGGRGWGRVFRRDEASAGLRPRRLAADPHPASPASGGGEMRSGEGKQEAPWSSPPARRVLAGRCAAPKPLPRRKRGLARKGRRPCRGPPALPASDAGGSEFADSLPPALAAGNGDVCAPSVPFVGPAQKSTLTPVTKAVPSVPSVSSSTPKREVFHATPGASV